MLTPIDITFTIDLIALRGFVYIGILWMLIEILYTVTHWNYGESSDGPDDQ